MSSRDSGTAAAGHPASGALDPAIVMRELDVLQRKLAHGARVLTTLREEDLAIATTPKDEVYREDMVRLYRYRPLVEKPLGIPVLVTYALVGRYQMIDLEEDRSFVRKLLMQGLDVYVVDWGMPKRAQRWLTIDDYVNGYLDACVDTIRRRHAVPKINLLGICQGGVFSVCYAALHPDKIRNLILTVTPVDFHADQTARAAGSAYMNLWSRALKGEDIDGIVDALGSMPGSMVGFSFLMMNPMGNVAKYTTELVEILDDETRLLNFLRMERWIGDRPSHPGEVVRQWLQDLYQQNKLIRNELVLGERRVDLRDVTMPLLNVFAEGDSIIPPCCTRNLHGHFGTTDYTEIGVPGGHIGTFVGAKAQKLLAPAIVDWLKQRM